MKSKKPKQLLPKRLIAFLLAILPAASISSFNVIENTSSVNEPIGGTDTPSQTTHMTSLVLPTFEGAIAHKKPEALLVRAIELIRSGKLEDAQLALNQLITAYPNYKLAYLIQGDLLLARQHAISTLGNLASAQPNDLSDLRHEAKVRVDHYVSDIPTEEVPSNAVKLADSQKYILAVDVVKSRMFVYQNVNGLPKRIDDFYITIGKNGFDKYVEGDQRTPLGVYFVTSELAKSTLPDMYGDAAFPLNYPNEWDKRENRTGHGIWIHGSPSGTYSRPPLSSNGCVALTNPDLGALRKYLQVGITPVIISKNFQWVKAGDQAQLKSSLESNIESWRKDWESLNTQRYLSHYADSFKNSTADLSTWKAQKSAVNATRKWLKVGVKNLSLFAYPGKSDLVVATFEQNYESDVVSGTSIKRQYWQRFGNDWKIVFEDAA
ncbi:L,D-transpeptidase family protein [Leeia sp. TBRC 13508]|uniref:L,D-transpeptidase family protein n=1 Tax=Leeia speluncae TaxID=2884804 RepID=A0ABS8D5N8_9NEIS|nr:L,D-transpeptidase family protein [Leeia speluncae]MCB6183482.1 L,D-transpeptidase family protein [Leeia speluncae]